MQANFCHCSFIPLVIHSFICQCTCIHPKRILQYVTFLQLVSFHGLFYLTELNEGDNYHSFGACVMCPLPEMCSRENELNVFTFYWAGVI